MMLAAAGLIFIAVFGMGVIQSQHEHTENLIENAGAENSTLEKVGGISTKLIPFLVVFTLVIVGIAVIVGIFGGF